MATIFKLPECFGKRKRLIHTSSDGSISSSSMSHSDATSSRYEQQQHSTASSSGPDNNHDVSCGGRLKNCSQSNKTTYNSSEKDASSDYDDRKPASLSTSFSKTNSRGVESTTTTIAAAPFLMLGSDVMISVVSFLDPKETLNILTMPICKEWRLSYTSDQDLWRTICSTDPFSADLDISSTAVIDDDDADDGDSFCSLNTGFNCDTGGINDESNNVLGEYRLVYTSFVRCMNYLNRIQNDIQNNVQPSSSVKDNNNSNNNDDTTSRVSRFPTFGVTKPLKKFLAKSKECGVLKSVIGTGTGTHSDNASAPIGVSADGRTIHVGTTL
jgi:hypothetical protein